MARHPDSDLGLGLRDVFCFYLSVWGLGLISVTIYFGFSFDFELI